MWSRLTRWSRDQYETHADVRFFARMVCETPFDHCCFEFHFDACLSGVARGDHDRGVAETLGLSRLNTIDEFYSLTNVRTY